jgi:tRNA (cytidine/uridine-2'-O-)-methyltransferase
MFHIVLHEPEIPPNTGNIIRLCANTGATLHLVRPLGFTLDKRSLRRAGLDYDDLATVSVHTDFPACRAALATSRWFAIETGGARRYSDVAYQPGDALLFGSERTGLPPAVLATLPPENHLSLPMRPGNRSLNLSNAVAVVAYEAWRQTGFAPG